MLEKTKALQTLNAFINGSYSGNNQRFSFLENSQKWFGASMLGVSLDIPIFSSFKRSASTQRARLNLEKSKEDLARLMSHNKLTGALYNRLEDDEDDVDIIDPIDVYEKDDDDDPDKSFLPRSMPQKTPGHLSVARAFPIFSTVDVDIEIVKSHVEALMLRLLV